MSGKCPIDCADYYYCSLRVTRELSPSIASASCRFYVPFVQGRETNFDRFRMMSVDELTEWLSEHLDCSRCPAQKRVCHKHCKAYIKRWLEKGVKRG
jgi:hypothetical protein